MFYMIFLGGAPDAKHNTYEEAVAEAERLVQKYPDRKAYVLKSVSETKTTQPPVETIRLGDN